jgi:hypothetical protein
MKNLNLKIRKTKQAKPKPIEDLFGLLLILAIADILTTVIAVGHLGLTEINPIAAWLIASCGFTGFIVVKYIAILALGAIFLKCRAFKWLVFWNALYGVALINNIWEIYNAVV